MIVQMIDRYVIAVNSFCLFFGFNFLVYYLVLTNYTQKRAIDVGQVCKQGVKDLGCAFFAYTFLCSSSNLAAQNLVFLIFNKNSLPNQM